MESKCYEDGYGKEWRNSYEELHREDDLPAMEYGDGDEASKEWYINGERHRELGPAIIRPNGYERWYLNDIKYFPKTMPSFLYVNYLKWEYRKKNGI